MTDESTIHVTHDGDTIELDGRHCTALLLADSCGEITSTEAREVAPVELPHGEQGTRIFRDLEAAGLMESWQPDERTDGRAIPAPMHAHLTRKGREFVADHRLKLETREPLSRDAEVVRKLLAEHRDKVDERLDEVEERVSRLERKSDVTRDQARSKVSDLRERIDELEAQVDGTSKAVKKIRRRVSTLESTVSKHADFINEQGKSLKKLQKRVKSKV